MMIYIVLSMLFAFLAGYILGKRRGWATGYLEAEAVVPLNLRQQSLEQGQCVICEEYWLKTKADEKNYGEQENG
ncbi:hypothetical protein [Sporomusa termitida]|uniref:Uncharacterized protein n=1 Tax=Sporomusa termitida TaxID=2377 RepID=A0A517DTC8_9FIRM|nr:hypothetical protein [Sporomusa termitida]QDR80614.1 hypothetical protein SPTER_19430 [Sporomusa termitida]